jgi:hypothetical protein
LASQACHEHFPDGNMRVNIPATFKSPIVIAGAALCSVALGLHTGGVSAKSMNWELVPPPPPTPLLNVPPPPVMLPYSYAVGNTAPPELSYLMGAPSAPAITVGHPPKPNPNPNPRPTGARPANAPNLSSLYARSKGFGAPRGQYDGKNAPGAVDAFPTIQQAAPVNTWFDASMRWYAGHVNAQKFFNDLSNHPEAGMRNISHGTVTANTIAYDDRLPLYQSPSLAAPQYAHHSSGRHHRYGHYRSQGHRLWVSH